MYGNHSFQSSGRAGFAPRGGRGGRSGRGGWGRQSKRQAPPEPDIVKHPLGQLITTIINQDLTGSNDSLPISATIADCEYVASYNWMNERVPTIMVPGKPPLWKPLQGLQQMKEDSGDFYRDPNAARFPSYPLEPAVQAIFKENPAFQTAELDIFACGSTLGSLLRFVKQIDKPFRFTVEVIGNTVFFGRRENSRTELIADVRGYGHTFPEAYTTWEPDVRGSETYQRLIRYSFGGLKCLVRFECDGYISTSERTSAPQNDKPRSPILEDNDLIQSLQAISVSAVLPQIDSLLSLKTGGSAVPQSSIFDLKTRSGRWDRKIGMEDIHPLLYIKQIPNFIVAYHDGYGRFSSEKIEVRNVQPELHEWETVNKSALERLAVLLRKIIEVSKNDERGLLEVYCPSPDRLEIHNQHGEGSHALPKVLRQEWEEGTIYDAGDASDSDEDPSKKIQGIATGEKFDAAFDSDSDDGSKDFTACSVDSCGYCGKCTY